MHEQLLVAAVLSLPMHGGKKIKPDSVPPLTPSHSLFKNEGDVLPAGEATQPPEAHHAEDGDLLGGRRV